ncbi:MAG TPA: rhomboid family intramembrane serine protease [Bacteroidia bacterium]|nr:rhomboid family intramembrane serine protease [Bacteroidia bacterium]
MTLIIIIAAVIISILAFSNQALMGKLIFNPFKVSTNGEWYRFITSGFIHADWMHLFINMLVLYSFGTHVEAYYSEIFGDYYQLYYMLLYLGALVISIAPSYAKHKKDFNYNALGASGAVSAVLFASVIFNPLGTVIVYFIKMPAILMALLYVGYEYYMGKKGGDNINHDAHLWGAIFGVVFTIGLKPKLALYFFERLTDF